MVKLIIFYLFIMFQHCYNKLRQNILCLSKLSDFVCCIFCIFTKFAIFYSINKKIPGKLIRLLFLAIITFFI